MLHPVGDLRAAVYWRRRLVVLVVLIALLGGGGWLALTVLARTDGGSGAAGQGGGVTTAARTSAARPALERVLPSLAGVRTPLTAPLTPAPETGGRPSAPTTRAGTSAAKAPAAASGSTVPAGPAPGSRCTDDMIELAVRVPASAPAGSKPTFELVVTNSASVPCTRRVDKELQEMVLLDGQGTRVWGSNDCFPESNDDRRLLQPKQPVVLPLLWGGRTSEPTCTEKRTTPPAGNYVVRGRLHTKTTKNAPLRIT